MIAYKAFERGLICRGYKFQMGLNVTEKAQAAAFGFHCAEDPLDCLSYYSNMQASEYYIVDAAGDIDESTGDTKIACTELTIIKELALEEFVLHALAYMVDHPKREWNNHVAKDRGEATWYKFVIVRGEDPVAKGRKGDILAFAREAPDGSIAELAMTTVDGVNIMPGCWYGVDLSERTVKEP